MKAKLSLIFFILTLVAGCLMAATRGGFPAASALGAGDTVRGLQAVIRGAPGTFVMQHGEQFLLAWPHHGQYAIAMIGEGSAKGVQALRQGAAPLGELVRALEGAGWKFAAPSALPAAVLTTLGTYSLEAAATGLRSLPSVLLLPVAILPSPINAEVVQ